MNQLALSAFRNSHLIGLFGQSNANGFPFADGYDDPAVYDPQHNRYIFDVLTSTWQLLQQDVNNRGAYFGASDGFGIEMRFMELMQDHYGADQYLLKYAQGGIPIAEDTGATYNWSPDSTDLFMFKGCVDYYWNAMNSFPVQKIPMKVFIWIQGEADMNTSADAAAYQKNFTNLYAQFRNQFNLPGLKCINVGIGDGQTSAGGPLQGVINTAKKNVTINGSRFVSADGLPTHDGVHFTGDSYNTLAERIFDTYITMV